MANVRATVVRMKKLIEVTKSVFAGSQVLLRTCSRMYGIQVDLAKVRTQDLVRVQDIGRLVSYSQVSSALLCRLGLLCPQRNRIWAQILADGLDLSHR